MHIGFNKPYVTGKEISYMQDVFVRRKLAGDGYYTQQCNNFFESKYGFKKVLLTTSCTDALEMAALLIDIKPGDEVIMPSFTFVSTANAFVLRGAKIVFADCYSDNPNMDADGIEKLITPRTKVIVPVHYAGVACDMDKIMTLAHKHNLVVVEDAALSIDSFYKGKPLGSIGHLGAFSFHESKNIISGEGGMIAVNRENFIEQAEIIREKGTDRSKFFRGEVDKYGWVAKGSSFLPSEMIAAFLLAQLESIDTIQQGRQQIWRRYYDGLKHLAGNGKVELGKIPAYATNNAHMFYLVCKTPEERNKLIEYLSAREINAVFHYLSLHKSKFYTTQHDGRPLPNTDKFADCLLRLPFYYELMEEEQARVIEAVDKFYSFQ